MIGDATDEKDKIVISEFAKYPLNGAEVRKVNSWQGLSDLLQEYGTIKRLVLHFHGSVGSLFIGQPKQNKGLREFANELKGKMLPTVKDLILKPVVSAKVRMKFFLLSKFSMLLHLLHGISGSIMRQ